jgi:hypothetical protein
VLHHHAQKALNVPTIRSVIWKLVFVCFVLPVNSVLNLKELISTLVQRLTTQDTVTMVEVNATRLNVTIPALTEEIIAQMTAHHS